MTQSLSECHYRQLIQGGECPALPVLGHDRMGNVQNCFSSRIWSPDSVSDRNVTLIHWKPSMAIPQLPRASESLPFQFVRTVRTLAAARITLEYMVSIPVLVSDPIVSVRRQCCEGTPTSHGPVIRTPKSRIGQSAMKCPILLTFP